MKNFNATNNDIQLAEQKNFNGLSLWSLLDLATAYGTTSEDYPKLTQIYQELVSAEPFNAQYHASLALAYSKIGQYQKARDEAMIFLKMMPGAKDEVDVFLKTLPY